MGLVSKYIREQKRYTKREIKNIFEYDDIELEKFLKDLKAYGILKCVENNNKQLEMSELLEEDIEIIDVNVDNEDCLYVFVFVGVLVYGNRVIKVYPKYLLKCDHEPLSEMKQVIKVLEKYNNSEEQIVKIFNGADENRSFNILAVILYLLHDYYEYGIYSNSDDIVEINGEGDILWQKTIDEGFALIENNNPYYMELFTQKTIDDEMDYFKRLHECILTKCSQMLHNAQLDELFEINEITLSEESLKDFGEKDYVLDRISRELNIQFNTRKQILLKTMYAFIEENKKMLDIDNGFSMFGTNAYHFVWEAICAEIFDNKLKTQLGKLSFSVPLSSKYSSEQSLIDVIEKPKWVCLDGDIKEANKTLKPDLVNIRKIDEVDCFMIFDAKYYNLQLEKNKSLKGNPGIGDVTKQYLYQLAYKGFIQEHGIDRVVNCFLLPTENDKVVKKGFVKMDMLDDLGLEKIQVFLIPAKDAYDLYLNKQKFDISILKI